MNSISKLSRIICSAILGDKRKYIVHTFKKLSSLQIVVIINIILGVFAIKVSAFIFVCVHLCAYMSVCML